LLLYLNANKFQSTIIVHDAKLIFQMLVYH